MISDERLKKIAEDDHVQCGDASAIAKELLALRKAFSEPIAWIYQMDVDQSEERILAKRNKSPACQLPVYRKPTNIT